MNILTLTSCVAATCLLAGCDSRTGSSPSGSQSGSTAASSTPATTPAPVTSREPDNTGVNKRDRDGSTLTPGDQASGSEADRTITAEVRRSITSESGMSINARNVKIITKGGIVTLRGPVDSQAEKDSIEAKAKAVAGVTSVDNQLEITAR